MQPLLKSRRHDRPSTNTTSDVIRMCPQLKTENFTLGPPSTFLLSPIPSLRIEHF
jgi:hypothetical protein